MLVGRKAELDRLDGLLARLGRGLGFALVLTGDVGAGKSALLDELPGRPGAGQVLRAYGTQSESEVAFSGLSELAQPLLAGLVALPARQRDTLRSVLALADAASEVAAPDTLAMFVAVTSLLASGVESRPRLYLIDDAQWLDAASAGALLFAARRLAERPAGFVFAVRAGAASAFDASWLPTLEIPPLGEADARALVGELAPDLGVTARGRVVAAAEGNPLALTEFARMAGAPWGGERLWSPGPLRVSERLERALGAEAAALPPAARQALVVLATAGTARLEIASAAVAAVTGTAASLDPAVDSGLAVIRGDLVVFRHPLVRSAVYQSAPAASVRAAHAALAAALDGTEPERAAWHRALAAPAPDEQVAAGLERTAALARRRGGHVAEARALARAARLSPDAGTGTARLLAAGTAALLAGEAAWARSLLDEVTARTDDPCVLADAEHELAQLAFWREGRRSPGLQAAARRVAPVDPGRAARLYSLELPGLITDYRVSAALPVAERAWELVGHGVEPFEVSFRVAHVLVMAGHTTAAAELADRAAVAVSAAGNTTAMIMLSQPLWWLERYETARDLLDGATAELRASGGLWMLVHALVARAELERRVGRLDGRLLAGGRGAGPGRAARGPDAADRGAVRTGRRRGRAGPRGRGARACRASPPAGRRPRLRDCRDPGGHGRGAGRRGARRGPAGRGRAAAGAGGAAGAGRRRRRPGADPVHLRPDRGLCRVRPGRGRGAAGRLAGGGRRALRAAVGQAGRGPVPGPARHRGPG